MGRGNSGRISSTNSQTGSQRMSGGGNAGSGSVPNSNAGFVVDGVRYYASRRDARFNVRAHRGWHQNVSSRRGKWPTK